MPAALAITFDADSACPWDVTKDGELVAGFEARDEAEAFAAELEQEARDEAEALAWEAGRAEETEREVLIEDLCEMVDAGDLAHLSLSELRDLASQIN